MASPSSSSTSEPSQSTSIVQPLPQPPQPPSLIPLLHLPIIQPTLMFNRRPHVLPPPPAWMADGTANTPETPYEPTPTDIEVVRAMLLRGLRLPPGVIDSIVDHAEYWAHSTVRLGQIVRIRGSTDSEDNLLLRSFPVGLTNLGGQESAVPSDAAYATSPLQPLPLGRQQDARFFASKAHYPTPRLLHPVRKIVFYLRSQDQGWSSDNSTSWTWFEAGLERFDAENSNDCGSGDATERTMDVSALRPVQPGVKMAPSGAWSYDFPLHQQPKWEVKRNPLAEKRHRDHVITWSYLDSIDGKSEAGGKLEEQGRGRETGDGRFVRSLKLGDVVTLWGKARFPGWTNRVDFARVDVYWAI